MMNCSLKSKVLLSNSKVKGKNYLDDNQFEKLFEMYMGGCIESRNSLVECNMGIVRKVVSGYLARANMDSSTVYYAELKATLMQEGCMGLMHALGKFDPEISRFSTYATIWIKEYIRQSYYRSHIASIPSYRQKISHAVTKIGENYHQMYGEKPSVETLVELTGFTEKQVRSELNEGLTKFNSLSIDAEDDELPLVSDLLSFKQDNPDESNQFLEVNNEKLRNWVDHNISKLAENEKIAIRYYFGFGVNETLRLIGIGKILGVTKERARQILNKAKDKLAKKAMLDGIDMSSFL